MKHPWFVYISPDDFADAYEVGWRSISKARAEAEEGVGEVVKWQRRYSKSQARAIYDRASETLRPWQRKWPKADEQVAHYQLPIKVIIKHILNAVAYARKGRHWSKAAPGPHAPLQTNLTRFRALYRRRRR